MPRFRAISTFKMASPPLRQLPNFTPSTGLTNDDACMSKRSTSIISPPRTDHIQGYAEAGLEVVPSIDPESVYGQYYSAPEALHSAQHYPLEVVPSDDLVPAHDPKGFPPEHAEGLDRKKEVFVEESEKNESVHSHARPRRKLRWIALAVVLVALVGAGVGLGVGLTVGRKSRFVYHTCDLGDLVANLLPSFCTLKV